MAFFSDYFKTKGEQNFPQSFPLGSCRLSKCHSTWLVQSLGKPPWPCHTRDKVYFKLSLPLCRDPNQPISRAKQLISSNLTDNRALESKSSKGGWTCSAPLCSGPTALLNAKQKKKKMPKACQNLFFSPNLLLERSSRDLEFCEHQLGNIFFSQWTSVNLVCAFA